jgi:hypothetical protein
MDELTSKKIPSTNKLGVGLFEIFPQPINLSEQIEDAIISYLDISHLAQAGFVNKNPWFLRISVEIKRRKNCVTIYTWNAGQISSHIVFRGNGLATQGRMGHSALKTYVGGKNNKGIYISFYPGECHRANHHLNSIACKKSISHFHDIHADNMENVKKIDLYGLNIDELLKAFKILHDENMNSCKAWGTRYNCSDVVLHLLNKAGLFEIVNYNPLNGISGILVSYAAGRFFHAVSNEIYLFIKLRRLYYSGEFFNIFGNYDEETSELIFADLLSRSTISIGVFEYIFGGVSSRLSLDIMIKYFRFYKLFAFFLINMTEGASLLPGTTSIMYIMTNYILNSKYHFKGLGDIGKTNALRAMQFTLLYPFIKGISVEVLSYFGLQSINELIRRFEANTYLTGMTYYSEYAGSMDRYYVPFVIGLFKYGVILAYPALLLFGVLFSGKYYYDTTTTPQHVFNISKNAQPKLIALCFPNRPRKNGYQNNLWLTVKNTAKKAYENKGACVGGLLAGVGIFAVGAFLKKNKYLDNILPVPTERSIIFKIDSTYIKL